MLRKVGQDDQISFRNNKNWLNVHPTQALIFTDLYHVWAELRGMYNGSFKNLVFGALPAHERVLQILQQIKDRLALVV